MVHRCRRQSSSPLSLGATVDLTGFYNKESLIWKDFELQRSCLSSGTEESDRVQHSFVEGLLIHRLHK